MSETVRLRFGDTALAKIAAHVTVGTAGVHRLAPGRLGRLAGGWTPGGRRDSGASVTRGPGGAGVEVAVRIVLGLDPAGPAPKEVVAAVARRVRDALSALEVGDVWLDVTVVDLDV